jgi:hypothetical protein
LNALCFHKVFAAKQRRDAMDCVPSLFILF